MLLFFFFYYFSSRRDSRIISVLCSFLSDFHNLCIKKQLILKSLQSRSQFGTINTIKKKRVGHFLGIIKMQCVDQTKQYKDGIWKLGETNHFITFDDDGHFLWVVVDWLLDIFTDCWSCQEAHSAKLPWIIVFLKRWQKSTSHAIHTSKMPYGWEGTSGQLLLFTGKGK